MTQQTTCPACGRPVEAGATTCRACGRALPTPGVAGSSPSPGPPRPQDDRLARRERARQALSASRRHAMLTSAMLATAMAIVLVARREDGLDWLNTAVGLMLVVALIYAAFLALRPIGGPTDDDQ